jgi:uncharacterized protein (DUF58 family)
MEQRTQLAGSNLSTESVLTHRSPFTTHHSPQPILRLTREGRYWLLIALILEFLGIYKGVNLLCLLADVMLVILLLNVLLASRGLRRVYGVRRIKGPALAGEPFAVELRAVNTGNRTRYGFELVDQEPERKAFAFAARMASGQTLIHRREVTLPIRGRHAWGPLDAVSAYPFGLAERRLPIAAGEEVLVLPRVGRLHRGRLRRLLLSAGQVCVPTRRQARRHPTAQSEFHGLRAFRSGDSPRWIHWRTSARCGELMVREFEDVPTDNLILVLDPATGDGLETAISFAATVAWEWCRQKGDHFVLAVASARPIVVSGTTGFEHAVRMLESLADLQGEPDLNVGAMMDRLVAERLPAASVLVVSPRDPTPLQGMLSQCLHRPALGMTIDQALSGDFYELPVPAGGNSHAT